MADRDLWLDDISRLHTIGTRDLPALADDLTSTARRIRELTADPSAFGNVEKSQSLADVYAKVRTFMETNSQEAAQRVESTGRALTRIAEIYEAVERKNSMGGGQR